jgi:hypothetical protein
MRGSPKGAWLGTTFVPATLYHLRLALANPEWAMVRSRRIRSRGRKR